MQTMFALFSAAAPAAATATSTSSLIGATTAATAAAAPAFSVSQILSGGASLLSAVSSIAAGNAQAQGLEMQAADADAQKPLELIAGLDRKNQAKKATMQAIGDIDTAYAASGADLSFGTPVEARKAAFREGDFAENSNAWTTGSTIDRLELKRKQYLAMAGRARLAGLFDGVVNGLSGFAKLSQIGPAGGVSK